MATTQEPPVPQRETPARAPRKRRPAAAARPVPPRPRRRASDRRPSEFAYELLQALEAVHAGNFSARLRGERTGLSGKIADAFNNIASSNERLASELQRVGDAVGQRGQIRHRVKFPNLGAWAEMETSVNHLIEDLLWPTAALTDAVSAVAEGDLQRTVPLEVGGRRLAGEFLRSATIVNTMIRQLGVFSSEVTRVSREVGTDGKLGGQAKVREVRGVWRDLTESVNLMASNLTAQVRNISDVTIAVANGDLSKKITADARGEILQLKEAVNTMVEQLRAFSNEVTRVAREVGTEGRLGGQAIVPGVAGTWKDLTDSVNSMANNLTTQVRNIANVTTAVARGDLSRKITVNVRGEILELKETINTMVDQLNAFAGEVTRVSREVGTEGKLGGQAQVQEVSGIWKDLTDNVNLMAGNLTAQVRNIAEVTIAVASGDLSKKITADARGEILQLKEAINTMVEQLRAFSNEVTRVAREVGTEGRLGGQATVPGVAGTWKDLTDSVNSMANNLTSQVRNIAEVTTAVASGDLSRKITVDAKGEILELKSTINTMVDQLNAFAGEVTRMAWEVGTEGRLGGQAQVPGVAGTWKDLTDNVNFMANNLTAQVRNIAEVATAIARGDLSRKITVNVSGEMLQLKDTINTMVDQLNAFASEVTRVAREVGTEGRLGGQADVRGVAGTWKDLTDNVNFMANNLTAQVRNIAEVSTAIARGDLSRKITVNVRGEILELKETINTMVDRLNAFAGEVTRVAREVGTEGRLGGQAEVPGAAGIWKDLTDNVNVMASNLTEQVRGIVKVVTAVATGDLKQNLTMRAKGEVAALADTINGMTATLATFAEQVSSVAREVGVEGRLGGQANVPGASGTWKDLTANVNLLAANLTTQVRAIAEVATAVTKGDLTRSIQVEARGEVAELKDNINTMIVNLRRTTERGREEDWLKTNLARVHGLLQGQRDLATVGRILLSELTPLVHAQRSVLFRIAPGVEPASLELLASYAGDGEPEPGMDSRRLRFGEGLVGQCALERQAILMKDVQPEASPIHSGLFRVDPQSAVVLPVLFEGQVKAVIELASLGEFTDLHLSFLEQLTATIGIVLNSIEANMKTESLLQQSQQLTFELQTQQAELQATNDQLALKAQQLAEQNAEVERKNEQIEQARRALEDKANELALTSKYKSEFLANMSHELRTPLNSILILGQQLAQNADGNLDPKQVEYARTIHSAGTDLLNLITDILDLSKIESGTVSIEAEPITYDSLCEGIERAFRHEAESRRLQFQVDLDAGLRGGMNTDSKRLMQVLKNLLSNAFKFTADGSVEVRLRPADHGWSQDHPTLGPVLERGGTVVAFEVVDTGIGIPQEKQKIIFEAFQQADASTSRKFGGTGLGLAISRELATLLGGEIQLRSTPGEGSVFTLFVPAVYVGPARASEASPKEASAVSLRLPTRRSAASSDRVQDRERWADDRAELVETLIRGEAGPGAPSLLIVEDELHFARALADLAHKAGFRVLLAPNGSDALTLAREFRPTAISLDLNLPDIPGWTVLSQLKRDPVTRHIPIQILSLDENRQHGLSRGAFSFLIKPASPEGLQQALERIKSYASASRHRLLVVEDDAAEQLGIQALLEHDDLELVAVTTGEEALSALREQPFDCVVLDLRLPDMSGFDLLDRIAEESVWRDLPIVVYTGRELSSEDSARLRLLARRVVLKGVESPERLLDETALFLHRPLAGLPSEKRRMIEQLHNSDDDLQGKPVLVVDDDVRNIFALSSVLERHGMRVLSACTGREAIEKLSAVSDIAIVLMDIMMPEMDGYETIRCIRQQPLFQRLPIVALTAKAMRGDREKCLEAGASEYLAKPVDPDQLLTTLRTWLHR